MELAQLLVQCTPLKRFCNEPHTFFRQFRFLYVCQYSGLHEVIYIYDKDNGIAVMTRMMRRAISVGNEGGRGGVAHGEAPINPG